MFKIVKLVASAAAVILSLSLEAQVIYVKADAAGSNDGTTWANAYKNLQTALALSGTRTIWIAQGTYTPGASQSSTFRIDNKSLYGGFAGTETDPSQRDLGAHQTILSGQNLSFNVVTHLIGAALLDGLVITGGNANGAVGTQLDGAGVLAESTGSITIENCRIVNNRAIGQGGGVFAFTSPGGAVTILNSVFYGNTGERGAGVYSQYDTYVRNCTFSSNTNTTNGFGALYFGGGGLVAEVKNTIIWGNPGSDQGASAGGIAVAGTNSIIESQVNMDPMFANAANGDLHLLSGSPAIDAGSSVTELTDADGMPRTAGAAVDIGAFEYQLNRLTVTRAGSGTGTVTSTPAAINCGTTCAATLTPGDTYQFTATPDPGFRFLGWGGACGGSGACSATVPANVSAQFGHVLFVSGGATGANDGTTWPNAFRTLQAAIAAAATGDEIWVAGGTYHPDSSFNLRSGIAIFGGFAGNETTRQQRAAGKYITTLSGDLGSGVHSQSVVNAQYVDAGAFLTGVTITGGSGGSGGGVNMQHAWARIIACKITGNSANSASGMGGGVYVQHGGGTVSDCTISNNSAGNEFGGGVAIDNSEAFALVRSQLVSNQGYGSVWIWGGRPLIDGCQILHDGILPAMDLPLRTGANGPGFALVRNCEIVASQAVNYPVVDSNSDPTFLNCTIVGRPDNTIGTMKVSSHSPSIINTIMWGNADVSKNFVNSGAPTGSNNLSSTDPLFASGSLATGNYRPAVGSPAIDAGNNTVPNLSTMDITEAARQVDDPQTADTGTGTAPFPDIGAYELQPVTVEVPASVGACTGAKVTLTATAAGYGTLTYQWRKASAPIGSATTSPSYVIASYSGADAGLYDVIVTDTLGSQATSSQIDLHDGGSISISGFTPTSGAHGTQVTIDGTGFDNVVDVQFNGASALITSFTPTEIVVVVSTAATTGPITVLTAGCQATSAGTFTTPAFGAPVLSATKNSQTSITLTWSKVGGTIPYSVWRETDPSIGFVHIASTSNSTFTDTSVLTNHVYLYQVVALSPSGGGGAPSNQVFVSTPLWTEAIAQSVTAVKASQWLELRDAVGAVHVLAGLGPFDFANAVAAGTPITLQNLSDLRTALNDGRTALGFGAVTFADPPTAGLPIKKQHVDDVRSAYP